MGAQGVGTTGDQCRRALDGSTQNVYAGMQPERSEATLYSYEIASRMYSCEEQLGRCVQCQSWHDSIASSFVECHRRLPERRDAASSHAGSAAGRCLLKCRQGKQKRPAV